MTPTVHDITAAIEAVAPLTLQESWDNSGMQVGPDTAPCTGVLVCVDVTPQVVDEAIRLGCNLIVSHHPLIFKGLKSITGATPVERAVLKAITHGIAIYSSHTALDNAPGGVSHAMAARLGVDVERVLVPLAGRTDAGTGIVGTLPQALTPAQLVQRVKEAYGVPVVRCTAVGDSMDANTPVSRVAMCGGSGGPFIADAVKAGAQVYITGDVRYHDFADYGGDILVMDIGHYESEQCTKDIFYQIITQKLANFAVYKSEAGVNPVNYL